MNLLKKFFKSDSSDYYDYMDDIQIARQLTKSFMLANEKELAKLGAFITGEYSATGFYCYYNGNSIKLSSENEVKSFIKSIKFKKIK